jgi:hypothetical protein
MLTIDSAIEVLERGDGQPQLGDATTKTANVRRLTLDSFTLELIEEVRSEREPYGPWMFGVGTALVNPDRIGYWWRRARNKSGIDRPRRAHRRRPPRPRRRLCRHRRVVDASAGAQRRSTRQLCGTP